MEKKQSSIEWLEWQINLGLSERGLISALKEAKAMHKDEIIRPLISMGWSEEIAESHYNVIYGGNNEKIS